MRRSKQLKLGFKHQRLEFGGGRFATYNPNCARPLAVKTPIHVVMRSPFAKAHYSMLFFDKEIRRILNNQANRWNIRIYSFANNGNHLHFLCMLGRIGDWHGFIRAISGLIARVVTKSERGRAKLIKFWEGRPWTRILSWGRAYKAATKYLSLNKIEALGFTRTQSREIQHLAPPYLC